ncbi:HupE/UreJ family protein [Inquilinus ginsengisoli]|uniref:HupE/UreJ family protein n=1 Tax=Inquilinus ginsengisoli TaxID=363840 RepID=UPI003D26321B
MHFLLAGLALFVAYGTLNPESSRPDEPNRIELTTDDLLQLIIGWSAQMRRPPTPDEMRKLVENTVREEVLYREALALGLDKEDTIVKRRMAQKMGFLADDLTTVRDPTTAELRAWFDANAERFVLPGRVSFRHLYFSPDRPGGRARDAAGQIREHLAGQSADSSAAVGLADRFMFQDHYGDRTLSQVANTFGTNFTQALFQLQSGTWQGPIESGYGWHLVWMDSLTPDRVPAFEEVEPAVKDAWADEQRAESKRKAFDVMRARYEVVLPAPSEVVAPAGLTLAGAPPVTRRQQGRRRLLRLVLGILVVVLAQVPGAWAHEARPAYLELTETAPGRYDVLWRTPLLAGMRLPVVLLVPEGVRNLTAPTQRALPDSLLERRVIEVDGGLAGKRIDFIGLQGTITDVLVRVQLDDGGYSTTLVRPSRPWIEITASRGPLAVVGAFVMHGVEHILFGYDHLLFVLALILIVRSVRSLLLTVTAFTAAHSMTLALATLGVVHVPGPPVEAAIALSILLLACEIIRIRCGETSLTARWPWAVAFAFGLLHGLGFAGALAEIGLPRGDVPLALLAFNVGVELGQLVFIAAVLAAMSLARRLAAFQWVAGIARLSATYAIGVLAAFWFWERVATFWA